jgi:hypothetical protein
MEFFKRHTQQYDQRVCRRCNKEYSHLGFVRQVKVWEDTLCDSYCPKCSAMYHTNLGITYVGSDFWASTNRLYMINCVLDSSKLFYYVFYRPNLETKWGTVGSYCNLIDAVCYATAHNVGN